ncbi:hypothetical protein Tco_0389194 [Tanacetum coccineum]
MVMLTPRKKGDVGFLLFDSDEPIDGSNAFNFDFQKVVNKEGFSAGHYVQLVTTSCLPSFDSNDVESGNQCRFYYFLDAEIRYGYYRTKMHNLYTQLQQARREMQVQEYTYRSRICDLEMELNERTVTGDCYKKAIAVFIVACSFMLCDLDFEPLSLSLSSLPSCDLVSLTDMLILLHYLESFNDTRM